MLIRVIQFLIFINWLYIHVQQQVGRCWVPMDGKFVFKFAQCLGYLLGFENNTIMSIFKKLYNLRAKKTGRPLAVSVCIDNLSKLIYLYWGALGLRQSCQSTWFLERVRWETILKLIRLKSFHFFHSLSKHRISTSLFH